MRDLWITILSFVSIYALVGLYFYFSSKDKSLGKMIVTFGVENLVLSIIAFAVTCIIAFDMARKGEEKAWVLPATFFLPCVSLAVSYFNCRIFYSESSITYRNFWRKKTTIQYCEITDVEEGIDLVIFLGKRKIKIPREMKGREDFFEFIKPHIDAVLEEKKRRKKENTEPAPKTRSFRDSLHRPGEFIFLIVLYSIGFLFCFTIFVIYTNLIFFGLGILLAACAFCTYYAPKRSHSSEFWFAVAKLLVQESHLKLDKAKNADEDQQGTDE